MAAQKKTQQIPTALIEFDAGKAVDLIYEILSEKDLLQLKEKIEALLSYIESVERKHKPWICKQFMQRLSQWAGVYFFDIKRTEHNALIIPPDKASVILILTYVPITATKTAIIIGGLRRLAEHCGEFEKPHKPFITNEQITATLDTAQRAFRIKDFIAPEAPLWIFQINNSHAFRNAECAILGEGPRTVIMLYHPRIDAGYNPVIIFAHELGHALHIALTGLVGAFGSCSPMRPGIMDIIPEWFDEFNEALGVTLHTLQEKQEAFADVTALAILGSGMEEYLPIEFDRNNASLFVKYIKSITTKAAD